MIMKLQSKQFAEFIIEVTNSKSNLVYKDLPQDDPLQRKPDLTKSSKILGYKPLVSLEEGILKTINWVKEKI